MQENLVCTWLSAGMEFRIQAPTRFGGKLHGLPDNPTIA